jgi:predicted small secreted protein
MKSLKKMIVVLMIVSLGFLTVSCNTMKGMGEDVEAAGEKIQEQAD